MGRAGGDQPTTQKACFEYNDPPHEETPHQSHVDNAVRQRRKSLLNSDVVTISSSATYVQCKYQNVGCESVIEASEVESHMLNAQSEHLQLLEAACLSQADRITQLERQVAELRARQPQQELVELLNRIHTTIKELISHVDLEAISVYVKNLVQPRPEDNNAQLKPWQFLYLFIFVFNILCCLLVLGHGRFSVAHFFPVGIYMFLMSFHWMCSKHVSTVVNTVVTLYFIFVWALVNIFFLAVF